LSDLLIAGISLARPCELSPIGSLELLNLVWIRCHREFQSSFVSLLQTRDNYYEWEFSQVLIQAVKRADLSMSWQIFQRVQLLKRLCG
ncbi:hypothetical protein PHMEG_00025588, partial [Phytophthora megakarya]